jgi:hypothetical protein
MLFKRFVIPPMVAVPLRGAIEDGIDQPTAAAASPLNVIEIQKIAQTGSVVNVAPNTARPSSMPKTSTVFLALGKGQQRIERQPAHRLSADHARPTVVDGMRQLPLLSRDCGDEVQGPFL